jgi:hypothetical protein
MTLSARAIAVIVGLLVFAVFFPAFGVGACPSGGGCGDSLETFWGMPLPPGAWSSLPAIALGVFTGWLTYRLLGKA